MGLKNTVLGAGVLALAAGGPITFYSASDYAGNLKKSWFSSPPAATATASPSTGTGSPYAANTGETPPVASDPAAPPTATFDPQPMPSLAEVLRFDVTVEWVLRRWPRVSTGLNYMQLQGYRVPLVTGGQITDVAGALTYYFNAHQQAQRITLRGTTGDPQVLVSILTGRHHFARRLTNNPGLIVYEAVDANNKPLGTCKIRSAPVIKANKPYTRYEFDLVIDRGEDSGQ